MATTVYFTTNTSFHQHSLSTTRAQFSPVRHRTSFSSTTSITHIDQSLVVNTEKSEKYNNKETNETAHPIENSIQENIDRISSIITTDDRDTNDNCDIKDNFDIDEFLSYVGLRSKSKQPDIRNLNLRPLTQRLASPVCLLPLPKYDKRVRQALYIRLPHLKFLTTISDIESFCSTDANAKAQSLLPRPTAQTRTLTALNKSPKKRKLSKTDIVSMAVSTVRQKSNKISMNPSLHSTLKCHVILDRLEQSTIDEIMNNPFETISTSHELLCKTSPHHSCQLLSSTNECTTTRTTITTMRTEQMIVKRKSITTVLDKSKRFKSTENDNKTKNSTNIPSTLTYQRIYLKCFLCSKHNYVDAKKTDSDVLHSHWLEHGGKLLLNIYDSEIDSILTRVVEFFVSPKKQILEGKVKTVFILNSKEIRQTTVTNKFPSNDSCIILD